MSGLTLIIIQPSMSGNFVNQSTAPVRGLLRTSR
jgi:hypothetical protein